MNSPEAATDWLWNHYSELFQRFDDLSLARWLVQTLAQFEGQLLRLSHPLVGTYRLAAQVAGQRQIWFKRLVSFPAAFPITECCRAPLLPMVTRDILESGLLCVHCNETAIGTEDLPTGLKGEFEDWTRDYQELHNVAHWDDRQRRQSANYEAEMDRAAERAARSLATAAESLFPRLLDYYPAVVWEDHDECLGVRPEELLTGPAEEPDIQDE